MRSKTCKYKFVIFACFKLNLMLLFLVMLGQSVNDPSLSDTSLFLQLGQVQEQNNKLTN